MIARYIKCGEGYDLRPKREERLEEFRCEKCGSSLEPADLRWCTAWGTSKQDIELMDGVTMPGVEIPAVRYFVAPGTTTCPKGHAFREVE
jgi:hypothetical protein